MGASAATPDLIYDVVIPTRGGAPSYLDDAITSVLGQTLPPRRVIVVVDGRPDVASRIRSDWPQVDVRVLYSPAGAAVARQVGIEASAAPWVAFLDDDDLWRREKMAVTACYIVAHPECSALRSPYYLFAARDDPAVEFSGQSVDFHGDELAELELLAERSPVRNDFSYLDIEGDSLALLLARNRGVIGSTCVRREVLTTIAPVPPGTRPGDDHLLFCLVATEVEWHLIPEPLLFYRLHPGQDTRTADPAAGLAIIEARRKAWELCGTRARLPLRAYGEAYRREFRRFVWSSARAGRLVIAAKTAAAATRLLPRWRDRLLLLIPEPIAWRWHHRRFMFTRPVRSARRRT